MSNPRHDSGRSEAATEPNGEDLDLAEEPTVIIHGPGQKPLADLGVIGPIPGTGTETGARAAIRSGLAAIWNQSAESDGSEGSGDAPDYEAETTPLNIHPIKKCDLDQAVLIEEGSTVVLELKALELEGRKGLCLELIGGGCETISSVKYFVVLYGQLPVVWKLDEDRNLQALGCIEEADLRAQTDPCLVIPGLSMINCGEDLIIGVEQNPEDVWLEDSAFLCTLKVMDPLMAHEIRKMQRAKERADSAIARSQAWFDVLIKLGQLIDSAIAVWRKLKNPFTAKKK